jgi:hypothetical protein
MISDEERAMSDEQWCRMAILPKNLHSLIQCLCNPSLHSKHLGEEPTANVPVLRAGHAILLGTKPYRQV